MGGGLLQLVAFGAQDVYLTGSPQITYFKVLFKRHTNFAIEPIAQSFSGTVRYGSKVTAVISRNGDLLGDMWLEAVMTKGTGTNNTYMPGEQLIKSIELELGGQRLDRMTSTWYRFYDNLYRNTSTERNAYRSMVDFVDGETTGTKKRMFVPVLFWCCRSPGNYLPLIALQYHEVRVTFEFEEAANIPGISTTEPLSAELWCDYVYLDQEERKKFATQSHEYLVEQVMYTGDENVTIGDTQKSQQVRLSFNHPTIHGKVTGAAAGATAEAAAPIASVKLVLNGHDRSASRVGAVYNKIVPFQANKAKPDAGFYYMSFALSPTQHAPSGSLNFSRIDSAVLQLTFKAAKAGYTAVANVTNETETLAATADLSALRVMSVNYNVLRILSGMGGLAYSS
jgi:hypothetical protein